MADRKKFFEQKIKESSPGYDPKQKPVGQREWTPSAGGAVGAHNSSGYKRQTGGGPPPKKSLADLP